MKTFKIAVMSAGLGLGLCVGLAAGCSPSATNGPTKHARSAAAYELEGMHRNRRTDVDVDAADAILSGLAAQYESKNPPTAAGERGRWVDVEHAIYRAGLDEGCAVRSTQRTDEGVMFQLKLLDGRPGMFHVRRIDGPQVYEALATIGLFPDDPDNRAHAERLVRSFDQWMTQLGRKRKFADR